MSEKIDIYKQELISLFTMNFEEIPIRFPNSKYNWDNFEKIFWSIYKLLLETESDTEFVKYYYLLTISYINYTNYLKYISHSDYDNDKIYKFINNLKFEKKIINKIIDFSPNKDIRHIIKLYNPFLSIKTKKIKNQEYVQKFVTEYIQNTKQMNLISDMPNDNVKKILNIIIYRYVISKNNNYETYHNFYIKKIIDNKTSSLLDFNNFIKQIPFSKNILQIKTKQSDFTIGVNLDELLKFIISKFSKIQYLKDNNKYIITNKKYGGKITISIDTNVSGTEFNNNQINYSLMHYGIEGLHDLNFLKKTESDIEIKLSSTKIKDYTTLLDITHIIITSLKILETYPTDLYDCLYPIDYNNYYFLSFCIFFEFVKPSINKNSGVKKFIIDLVKYIYIYSYYDYYFYYSINLMDTIISNYNYKYDIFNDFINNLKNTLKLPKELFSYPPFFNIKDDINSVVYYNYEIPSYFKYFDLINAICYVFNKDFYKSNPNIQVINILQKHFDIQISNPVKTNPDNSNNVINNQKYEEKIEDSSTSSSIKLEKSDSDLSKSYSLSSSTSSNDLSDLKSRLDSDILTKMTREEKELMHHNNTYIELNVENSINCLFNTDIK